MIKVKRDLTGQIFGRLKVLEQAEDYVSPSGKSSPHGGVNAIVRNTIKFELLDLTL